jgi:abortive infection bacteriophage resistance protein
LPQGYKGRFSFLPGMTSSYKKEWKTFDEQVALLQERGMIITEPAQAGMHLTRHGYYRLSGYWYPMRQQGPGILRRNGVGIDAPCRRDHFLPDARFTDVAALYVWDKKLRLMLLDAIERLEIGVRVALAYECGKVDKFLHCMPELMGIAPGGMKAYAAFFAKHAALETRSKEGFMKHFERKYGGEIPIWVAVELWEFGVIVQFYSLLETSLRYQVSSRFDIKPDTFGSWLKTIGYLRNVCAHHARLWNRELVEIPAKPGHAECPEVDHAFASAQGTNSKLYPTLCLTAALLRKLQPKTTWHQRLAAHLHKFPTAPHYHLSDMGIPPGWDGQAVWS